MGSLVSGLFKGLLWIVSAFFSSLAWAISVPFTIMMLDDSARNLKSWYDN